MAESDTPPSPGKTSAALRIPQAYRSGYAKAAAIDPQLAARYMRYTVVDDPAADAAVESVSDLPPREVNRLIRAGMDLESEELARAPARFREFFEEAEQTPEWWDPAASRPGRRAFHDNSDLFISAFFVATVQNAATLIAKAFYATGRVNSRFGPRRIRQNTRHFIEIMMPGALDRLGEGWRLSVRIRLVHAQIRRLIRTEGNWDEAVYGVPLSAAHMGVASANFSATVLAQARKLGSRVDREARASFMQIWRYASWLIGTPEELLFDGDEVRTLEFFRIARICEPPPGEESRVISKALFDALPGIAGHSAPGEVKTMVRNAHRIARFLLGDELANQLHIPRLPNTGLIALLRGKRRVQRITHEISPTVASAWRGASFAFLLDAAVLDDLSYRIPDRLRTEDAAPW